MNFASLEFTEYEPAETRRRAESFARELKRRRTVREFSERPISEGVIGACLAAAHSAPSGANLQPWHFALIRSGAVKRRLREAAEKEERAFYNERAPQEWLDALAPFGTDSEKPFLLLVTGYPAAGCRVPVLAKRPLAELTSMH